MADIKEYRSIYKFVLDSLERGKLSRRELIYSVIDAFELSDAERLDDSMNGRVNVLRSRIGLVITDMENKGVIAKESGGLYYKAEDLEIAIRIEACEREILNIIKLEPRTRTQIKDDLVTVFGTDTTPTVRDDNKLFKNRF